VRKFFEIGGIVAAVILIAFGITSIVVGFNGRDTVQSSLTQEQIVGSPDMTPTAIKDEAAKAGLPVDTLTFPTTSVAGKKIDTGDEARAFAGYMRIHALEATGGLTYAQMGRFMAKPGTPAKYARRACARLAGSSAFNACDDDTCPAFNRTTGGGGRGRPAARSGLQGTGRG
jgi:hypothetical protein